MKVRYIPRARKDLADIYERIAQNNSERAQRIEDTIRVAGEMLAERPELGVATDEPNVRRWPMPEFRYTIFYRVAHDDDRIDILRVMDGRRVRNPRRVPR